MRQLPAGIFGKITSLKRHKNIRFIPKRDGELFAKSKQNQPLVEKFIADNKDSSYAAFAQFEVAKQAVEKGNFSAAKTALQSVLTYSDSTLQSIARFRLAQIDFQLKSYDEALASLAQIQDKAWELRKQILTGDILAAKGDIPAAKSAYEQAKTTANPQEQTLIDVRLNNL